MPCGRQSTNAEEKPHVSDAVREGGGRALPSTGSKLGSVSDLQAADCASKR